MPSCTWPGLAHNYNVIGGIEEDVLILEGPDVHVQAFLPAFGQQGPHCCPAIVPDQIIPESNPVRIFANFADGDFALVPGRLLHQEVVGQL